MRTWLKAWLSRWAERFGVGLQAAMPAHLCVVVWWESGVMNYTVMDPRKPFGRRFETSFSNADFYMLRGTVDRLKGRG